MKMYISSICRLYIIHSSQSWAHQKSTSECFIVLVSAKGWVCVCICAAAAAIEQCVRGWWLRWQSLLYNTRIYPISFVPNPNFNTSTDIETCHIRCAIRGNVFWVGANVIKQFICTLTLSCHHKTWMARFSVEIIALCKFDARSFRCSRLILSFLHHINGVCSYS